jgi:pimeloyl-ACP methyl ester carboxylesterase
MSKPLSLELPPGARSRTFGSARGAIAAIEVRPQPQDQSTQQRPAAVLVPGFTGSKEDFLPSLGALAATGRSVIAYDQRGQFETGGPDDPVAYAVPALAEDLLAVVDDVGTPVHLVGHSFGGIVARAAAIARPDAFRSLTLLDSGPGGITGPRRVWLELMAPVLAEGGVASLWAILEAVQAQDPRVQTLPADIRDFLQRRFLSQPTVAVQVSGQALLDEPDRVDELRGAYRGPILVAFGAGDDAWSPPEQEEMAMRLGVPHVVIPDALHSPAAENPEVTAKVLAEFWDQADATPPLR